jgi:hypothetical protein
MSPPTVWLSCGVLRAELEALHRQGKIVGRLLFLDSMLHMTPQKLERKLTAALERAASGGERLVLVYGDCCSRMRELAERFQAARVHAINCAQLLLGPSRYRELMRAQAFLLLPEWTGRWREVLEVELGLKGAVAREFMREHRRELVYVDTGLTPVPRDTLAACSDYTGLPWRVEPVTLDHLRGRLLEAEAEATHAKQEVML